MYCQACGAKNTDDARFCNMCGSSIAAVGAPGGPIAARTQLGIGLAAPADPSARDVPLAHARTVEGPALASDPGRQRVARPPDQHPTGELEGPSGYLPSAMNNTMSVSLEAIGVRSTRRTWGVIALASVALVAVGAGGMYLLEDRSPPPQTSGGGAEPDDPFVIGTPVPEGETLPSVDVVTGTNDVPPGTGGAATGGAGAPEGGAESGAGVTPTGSPTPDSAATGGGGTTSSARPTGGTATGGAAAGGTGRPAETDESVGGAEAGGSGTSDGEDGEEGDSAPGGEAPAGGEGDEPEPDGAEAPAERDIEMDMYSGRVRFLISRYYAARAQTCWDRATRADSTISGTVTIAMTIGPDGGVTAARVARNSTGDPNLGTCLQNEVRQWRLSPPPGGESVTMNLPFSR